MLESDEQETLTGTRRVTIRGQLFRLARHSLVYGLGGVISRLIAIVLLRVYTHYLPEKAYGAVALLLASEAVMVIVLRAGVQNAFFRFYYMTDDPAKRRTVIRTSFWFTMVSATAGLLLGIFFAPQIASALGIDAKNAASLVRATAVLLWADMNYQQQTAFFRAEQRSVSYAIASVTNVVITVLTTMILVIVFKQEALGLLVGNLTGTLCLWTALLLYRLKLLGFEFDWKLYRTMEHFGLPLLPSALALWATRFSDRFFVNHYLGLKEAGIYSFGVTIASATILIITAFQLAWPPFAYSISDDDEARRTYSHVLTYYVLFMTWVAVALSLLAPALAHILGGRPGYHAGARFVAPLAFGSVLFAGYNVVAISIGRIRKTGANWIITGSAALVDIVLNIILVPRYGAIGAPIALLCAYGTMFLGMSSHAQRRFYVPYQWRRVFTALVAGVGVVLLGKALSLSPLPALALAIAYPLALLVLGFYSAAERAQISALIRRVLRMQPA